jgi:hypothetical protein
VVLHRSTSWSAAFRPYKVIIPNGAIDDVYVSQRLAWNRMITRSAIRCADGINNCYGLVSVSAGYPPADGQVIPAFVSAPTIAGPWTYRGKMKGEPKAIYDARPVWNSTLALVLNPNGPAVPDPARPASNRFVTYVDAFTSGLALAYSADGITWAFYRDSTGNIVDVRPPEVRAAGQHLIFPSVARTPGGDWHMFATVNWPPANIHHLWSQDGVSWQLVGGDPSRPGTTWVPGVGKTTVPFWDERLQRLCVLTQRGTLWNYRYRMCITGQG